MKKSSLRIKYKKMRESIPSEELEQWSLEIANRTLELPIWEYSFYHIFLSIPGKKEVNTEPLLHVLQGKDKNVVLPKSDFISGSMKGLLLMDSTRIIPNEWHIPEPEDGIEIPPEKIDVVFIPLLAFDRQGHRIGYGKGFYDRFLTSCPEKTIKVGLSFFEAEPVISEIFSSDIPLDYCVTPSEIYQFKIVI